MHPQNKVEDCIKQLKNNKSAGENNITADILKHGDEPLIRVWEVLRQI